MPTVLRIGPYRFFFYSNEGGEPAHIHVQKDGMLAKFWLKPVELAGSTKFSPKDLRKLEQLVIEHKDTFLVTIQEHPISARSGRPAYRPRIAWSTCLYRYGALLNSYRHRLCINFSVT